MWAETKNSTVYIAYNTSCTDAMHMLSRDRRRLCMFRGGVRVCNAWHGKMWLSRSLVDLSRYRKDDLEDCEEKAIVVDMIIHKLSMIMMDQE